MTGKLTDFNAAIAAIDAVDLALTGYALAKRIATISAKTNTLRNLKNLGRNLEAADVNVKAMKDPTLAENIGVDNVTLMNNAQPFPVSHLDDAYAENLAASTVDRIKKVSGQQSAIVNDIARGEDFLREGFITEEQRAALELAEVNRLAQENLNKIEVASRTPTSTKFTAEWTDETGRVFRVRKEMDLTLDDQTATWNQNSVNILNSFLGSPTSFARGNFKDDVRQAIRLDSTASSVANQLRTLQREAIAPLVGESGVKAPFLRKELAELDHVLLAGDEYLHLDGNIGKVFSPIELRAGIDGVSLNEKQIESYYNLRNLFDNLFLLRNDAERVKLSLQGQREIHLGENTIDVGKRYQTISSPEHDNNPL